jgi:hypothetical protein
MMNPVDDVSRGAHSSDLEFWCGTLKRASQQRELPAQVAPSPAIPCQSAPPVGWPPGSSSVDVEPKAVQLPTVGLEANLGQNLIPGGHMSGKDVRESVGLLLVVASLVFVGMEIRQSTAVARAQSRQFLTENHREWAYTLATNPERSDLFNATWDPVEPIQ